MNILEEISIEASDTKSSKSDDLIKFLGYITGSVIIPIIIGLALGM